MTWQVRHQGSPRAVEGLTLAQLVGGLRDGNWSVTDEVRGPGDSAWRAIEAHPQLSEVVAEIEEPPARPLADETRLDMTALIDVTLVLLIFFILTTTRSVVVQKIIPLPTITDAKKGTLVFQPDQVKKYMIRLQAVGDATKSPTLRLEGQNIEATDAATKKLNKEKLTELLKPLVRGQPPKTEMILDAQGISWGTAVAIQDAAKAAGVRVVHHLHKKEMSAP